ncbi:MAG: flagellar biosynthetic protein FliO [Chloroflexi bacterium]|nr:flagellar biosynthetic protein FliO [Chloroflexota bacterium]
MLRPARSWLGSPRPLVAALVLALGGLGALLLAWGGAAGTGSEGSPPWAAAELAVKLLAVVALAYGSLWLLRRAAPGARWRSQQQRPLEVLDTLHLGQQRAIHLVRVGRRTLVVGVTPQQITPLDVIEDEALWPERPEAEAMFRPFDWAQDKLP